jgi:hypothetical protein
MGINIPDAAPEQRVTVDEGQNFRIRSNRGARQLRQGVQHNLSLPQIAQREFADDKRMPQHHAGIEQADEYLMPTRK